MSNFYFHYKILKTKYRLRQIRREMEILGAQVQPSSVAWFKPSDKQTVCHLIGSGWSLLNSIDLANSEDAYVVGFNNAALIDIKFDTYFVEFAGREIRELAEQQRRLLLSRVCLSKDKVFFKNLWLPRNDPKEAVEFFGDIASFIMDVGLPCSNPSKLNFVCNYLLREDDKYMRQYMSTIFALVAVAKHSGFKEIVLHGLDFGGQYFYETSDYLGERSLLPPSNNSFYAKTKNNKAVHSTNTPKLGVESSLPWIRTILMRNGINLYSASRESPSSRVLPVYKKLGG